MTGLAADDRKVEIKIAGVMDSSLRQSIESASRDLDGIAAAATGADEILDDISGTAYDTGQSLGGMGSKADRAGKGVDGINGALEDMGTVFVASKILESLEKAAGKFMECSEAASEYETALKKVESIADTSVYPMDSMRGALTELSNDTGVLVAELSESAYQAISASVDTAGAVEFVGEANQLAVGGFTSAATAVDVLTTAVNAYGLSAEDAGQISDYLITTQNKGKTTVDELASAVGKVIPLAAAYGVGMDNLSAAYAVTTANGIQTAEATTYVKSMLTELADSGSDVSKVLAKGTGHTFTELNKAGYSLGDVLKVLGDSVNGDATAFSNLWSSSEGATAALTIYNAGAEKYNSTLDIMRNSAGATAAAYEKMSGTTEFSLERMQAGYENISIAIGDVFNPALGGMYDMIADGETAIQGFIGEHPGVVAALGSIATALGITTAAVAGYTAATKAARIASTALSATNPAFLAVAAAGAAAAGLYSLVKASEAAEESAKNIDNELTALSEKQKAELGELEQEYDNACEKYGEGSYEAEKLKNKTDRLSKSYEENKTTIGNLIAENDELVKKCQEQGKSWDGLAKSIESDTQGARALVKELRALGKEGTGNASVYNQMKTVTDELNDRLPGLGLTYKDVSQNTDKAAKSAKKYIEELEKQELAEAATDKWLEAIQVKNDLELQIGEVKGNKKEAQKIIDEKIKQFESGGFEGGGTEYINYVNYGWLPEDIEKDQRKLDAYDDELKKLEKTLKDNQEQIDTYSDAMGNVAKAVAKAGEVNPGYARGMEAVQPVIARMKTSLNELAESYKDEYLEAYGSISSQIGLFSKMKTSAEITVSGMMEAFRSQEKYLEKYSRNIKKASKIGLDHNMLSQLSDGSQEAAGQLDAIVQKYKEIENSDGKKAARKWIKEFNKQFEAVEEGKETFSAAVGEMETGFSASMKDIVGDAEGAIKDMDLSGAAKTAAENTMDAYISVLESKTAKAVNLAEGMAISIEAAFNKGGKKADRKAETYTKKYGLGDVPAYAEGGIVTEPTFAMIGEDGDDEVVIPLNSSKRSMELWQEAGRRLGASGGRKKSKGASQVLQHFSEENTNTDSRQNIVFSPVFSPVINIEGNASPADVRRGVEFSYNDFTRMMKRYEKNIKMTVTGRRAKQ